MQAAAEKNVLISGCGTIGRIKALLWLKLGVTVYLQDINSSKLEQLLTQDSRLKKFDENSASIIDIVDISTPNDQHATSLKWAYEMLPKIQTVLIEKPICSTPKDKHVIEELIRSNNGVRVYINETYFWSRALEWINDKLSSDRDELSTLYINLSKDRLADLKGGRFFDEELEAYGIELPHALAMLQRLGISLDSIIVKANDMHRHPDNVGNQGIRLEFLFGKDKSITVCSFLGDFKVREDLVLKNRLERIMILQTKKGNSYKIEFDPVSGLPRYQSRITINDTVEIAINDDHMSTHLENVLRGNICPEIESFLHPANSMKIYDFIKSMRDNSSVNYIADNVLNEYAAVGEGVDKIS